jgi:NAD(P)H-nitrite reductase large subunit
MYARPPYDAEAREEKICQLIDARIHAIKHDIRVNRASTVSAVLERLDLGDFEGDACDILRSAVVGHSAAVGVDHAAAVELAIFHEAEALAEKDVDDMERYRVEESLSERAMRWLWNNGVLA